MSCLQPYPPAEEQAGRVGSSASAALRKLEVISSLKEELAFFRKKEAKPCQVDLLFVDFNLGKIGVVGEVGSEILLGGGNFIPWDVT